MQLKVFFTVGLYHSINVISNNAKRFFEYPVNIRRVAPGNILLEDYPSDLEN